MLAAAEIHYFVPLINFSTPPPPFPLQSSQLLSLTLDGLTGVSQDHMRAHYQTGSNHMMLNVNLWSTLFLGAGKNLLGAEGRETRQPYFERSVTLTQIWQEQAKLGKTTLNLARVWDT